jgi:hypothetical protein
LDEDGGIGGVLSLIQRKSDGLAAASTDRLLLRNSLPREPPLRGELDYQNQVRDHAADESDRPDELLQQRLISVSGIRCGFE